MKIFVAVAGIDPVLELMRLAWYLSTTPQFGGDGESRTRVSRSINNTILTCLDLFYLISIGIVGDLRRNHHLLL